MSCGAASPARWRSSSSGFRSRQEARDKLAFLDAELTRIQEQVELIREQAVLTADPETVSQRIDQISATLGGTTEWIRSSSRSTARWRTCWPSRRRSRSTSPPRSPSKPCSAQRGASMTSELPAWAEEMRDLFKSGSVAQFIIHGNVFDVVPARGPPVRGCSRSRPSWTR